MDIKEHRISATVNGYRASIYPALPKQVQISIQQGSDDEADCTGQHSTTSGLGRLCLNPAIVMENCRDRTESLNVH